MHVITMTTSLSKLRRFCTGNEKKKFHNYNIVEKEINEFNIATRGLNHEMHIFDDNQPGRRGITLKQSSLKV